MAHYIPPKQSKISQIIDVILLMALTIGALLLPGYLGLSGAARSIVAVENPTWESLGQTPVMVERWNALGFADAAAAHDMITARFDYSFTWGALLLMIVVIVGYFAMMLMLSEREYREVIAEKFGKE
ncbi:MAG: hypothetical protein JNK34_03385 [Tabrizicola sp.]|nr:hypothetical protein [Tabrizicola sp.]